MKSKNHDRLIRIFSQTHNDGWKLVIVGGAFGKVDLSAGLKQLAKELGVEDKVIFTGASKDVNSYLQKVVLQLLVVASRLMVQSVLNS